MEQKIEYLLNAVCYFLFRFRIRAGKCFDSVFFGFFDFLGFWLSKKLRVKYYERNAAAKKVCIFLCVQRSMVLLYFLQNILLSHFLYFIFPCRQD